MTSITNVEDSNGILLTEWENLVGNVITDSFLGHYQRNRPSVMHHFPVVPQLCIVKL